jgi:hypothetical protein
VDFRLNSSGLGEDVSVSAIQVKGYSWRSLPRDDRSVRHCWKQYQPNHPARRSEATPHWYLGGTLGSRRVTWLDSGRSGEGGATPPPAWETQTTLCRS